MVYIMPLTTKVLCCCTVSEKRLIDDVIFNSCNQWGVVINAGNIRDWFPTCYIPN